MSKLLDAWTASANATKKLADEIGVDPQDPVDITLLSFVDRQRASVDNEGWSRWDQTDRHQCELLVTELAWAVSWVRCGRPVFQLTAGLTAALLLTSGQGLTGRESRWPFPSFVVALPDPSPLSIVLGDNKEQIKALWATQYNAVKGPHQWNSAIGKAWLGFLQGKYDVSAARALLKATVPATVPFCTILGASERFCLDTIMPSCADEQDLEEWICGADLGPINDSTGFGVDPADERTVVLLQRLVANLCVYLDACHSDCSPTLGTVNPIAQIDGRRTHVVGRTVKLPRPIREAAQALGESAHRPASWKMRARFVVRGHWRNQACGPRLGDHKRIWIQPYWKGPTTEAELQRLYQAQAHGEAQL